MSNHTKHNSELRLLVAIASYGDKHLDYLKQVIATYKGMAMKVDVVVLSNEPKQLGDDVKVVIGLPSKNPWSLPFAHKPIFAENVDHYDLFIYSEDDIRITEVHINAFMRATSALPENEIAGHLLYEVDPSGNVSLPNFHGHFHWKPESVRSRNRYTVAEFTNEHSACYLITQSQLKKAIASGGFLRDPYEGHYDMLCAAATDPFTSCGFRKVICISHLDEFLLHHLPNRYVGKVGIPYDIFEQQVQAMKDIQHGILPATTLCDIETRMPEQLWSKNYHEPEHEELIRLVPNDAENLLSVGCGWGATENALKRNGINVTALPLDSVIGVVAARRGIEIVNGTLEEGLNLLEGRKFDCVMMSELLHLLPEQGRILEKCLALLRNSGTLLVSGPNFERLPLIVKRAMGRGDYRKLKSFDNSGVNPCYPGFVAKYAKNAGFDMTSVKWINHALPGRRLAKVRMEFASLTAKDWIVRARRRLRP